MNIEYIYLKHYDLIFHVMAYLKVDNASNLYDEKYIAKMAVEKTGFAYDLTPAVSVLQEYYNENFERLMWINFLPYYCDDYDDMKVNFLNSHYFTQDDLQMFIKPFIEVLDNESEFFFEYWNKLHDMNNVSRHSTEDYFQKELAKYSCVFDYFRKPCKIIFSYTITQNGRGLYSDSHFVACIRYPESNTVYNFSFILLLHEYTHAFTDGLLNKNINMNDGSHGLSEKLAIVADYFLIKSIDESFIPVYVELVTNGDHKNINDEIFLSMFNIDEYLQAELMELINNILSLLF